MLLIVLCSMSVSHSILHSYIFMIDNYQDKLVILIFIVKQFLNIIQYFCRMKILMDTIRISSSCVLMSHLQTCIFLKDQLIWYSQIGYSCIFQMKRYVFCFSIKHRICGFGLYKVKIYTINTSGPSNQNLIIHNPIFYLKFDLVKSKFQLSDLDSMF